MEDIMRMMMGGGMDMGGGMRTRQRQQPRPDDLTRMPLQQKVSINNVQSRPELNDEIGFIEGFDPKTRRYVVGLEDSNDRVSLQAEKLVAILQVTIQNTSHADLNGQLVVIQSFDEDTDRYQVVLQGRILGLKPENVKFGRGAPVCLRNLSKPELNGRWGRVQGVENGADGEPRYSVKLDAMTTVKVKIDRCLCTKV